MAKIFGAKFDMISPVWLQVLHKGKNIYEIGGTHDIDVKWAQEVRRVGQPGKKSNNIYCFSFICDFYELNNLCTQIFNNVFSISSSARDV